MALFDIFYSILFHFTPDYLIKKKKKNPGHNLLI